VSTTDAVVRLQSLDGTWETCGADRAISVDPESLQMSANEWGPDKAAFDLHRSPVAIWPDIGAFSPVEIEVGGVVVWEGRTGETPTRAGAEQVINVQCDGWQYQLDDDVYQRCYVHSKLTDWKDMRSSPAANLVKFTSAQQVQAGQGSIVLSFPKETTAGEGTTVGVLLDLGPGGLAKRVVVTLRGTTFPTGDYNIACRAADSVGGIPGTPGVECYEAWTGDPGSLSGVQAGTFSTACRYVAIFIVNTKTVTRPTDHTITVTAASIFSDTAFESGNASILHASTVVQDALEKATLLLSDDFSQIEATSFAISDFMLGKMTTPREAIEAANAYHNWVAKLLTGRRLSFSERPTDALLEIGAWSGADLQDTSANSGAEIYTRAIVEANGADGTPLVVVRTAQQQPGVLPTTIETPGPENPSFATDTASWSTPGSLTRNTEAGKYHSAPGCGDWGGGELIEACAGAFIAGITYRLAAMLNIAVGQQVKLEVRAGKESPSATIAGTGAYQEVSVIWTPQKNHTGVVLAFLGSVGHTVYVDDLSTKTITPTLADRRGFRRTKVIQVSSAITPVEGSQIADIFLQSHMTTPFKGSAAISPGGVRTILGGQPVHPSQLLLHTQELLRLSHLTDPDTGGIGRDGTIAEVTYTHKDQKAAVTLDDKRSSFDALLARLAVVQQAGS
jgi:hypothetical protein